MILRENIGLLMAGTEVWTYGEVMPLRTDETAELDRSPESVNYRLILPPLDPASIPHSSDAIIWLGTEYQIIGPAMKYTANGHLHHLELFMSRTTG